MYTLRFTKSLSKNYHKAVEMAQEFGAVVDGDNVILQIPDHELLYAYERIAPLFGLIQKWKGTCADYNGEKVDPYRFIFYTWYSTRNCAELKNKDCDPRYCWKDRDHEGWGCKKLNPMHRHIFGSGEYKRSNQFWYNFGEFDKKMNWVINKNLIFQKLMEYAEQGHLKLCPHFDTERVKMIVFELPDKIVLDGVNFKPFKEDGRLVNIRHCPEFLEANNFVTTYKAAKWAEICLMNQVSFIINRPLKFGRN